MTKAYKDAFTRELEAYLDWCAQKELHYRTRRTYMSVILRARKHLKEAGMSVKPSAIGEREMNHVVRMFGKRKWETLCFARFLRWAGNDVLSRMNPKWPRNMVTHRDWLEPDQMDVLREETRSGPERTLIALEGSMGLRRISVKRFRTDFIHDSYALVLGKGPMGGKWRTVPMSSYAREALKEMMDLREEVVDRALNKSVCVPIPPNLLLYERGGRLDHYKETQLDNFLLGLGERTGLRFSHHTLRRTYGRSLYKAGVKIETIAEILGHESIDQTREYLGIRLDDMQAAQERVEVWERNRKNLPPEITVWQR